MKFTFMTRTEQEKKISNLIALLESETLDNMRDRVETLRSIIIEARDYNTIYNEPYRRVFMRCPVRYTETFLEILEELLITAEKECKE